MERFSRRMVVLLAAILVGVGCTESSALTIKKGDWKALFDGKTLEGWEVRGGFAKYRVEEGTIVGTTVEGSPNTFLCTKKQYGDFILEFEVKVAPALNSGVQIRSHAYQKDTKLVVWRGGQKREVVRKAGHVYGYQVEISNEKTGSSGGIWDEARKSIWLYNASDNPAASEAFKDNQWNKFRVSCIGDSIKTRVNGVACADFRDPVDLVGFIGLQVHSFRGEKPAEVRWRNIRIRDLGRHVWKPIFDGKSLAGWHTLPGGKWEARDGMIVGTSSSSEGRHGLLVSDKRYGDFTVRLKFKAVAGNSGLYFRVDEVKSGVGVHGFQAEIDASKDVGGLYETGGRAWVVQPKAEEVATWFRPGEWNEMAVSAHGRRIVVHVNGRKTAELKNDPGRLEGHLALQLHGGQDMHVLFKDIEMLEPVKGPARTGIVRSAGGRMLFVADFEDGDIDAWKATDPSAWRIEEKDGNKVLSQFRGSKYKPPVRSPLNMNLIKNVVVGSFMLELKMLSTTRDYGHRDLCLFFGHQDPSHFYYVHIANKADAHANSIFIVDGEPRVSIAKTRTEGTRWDDEWHTVRLVRDVEKGTIKVFFDDKPEPIMTAVNDRFKWGKVGVGSFDDTGLFDDIRLLGQIVQKGER